MEVAGHVLPTGTVIACPSPLLHRDPRAFPMVIRATTVLVPHRGALMRASERRRSRSRNRSAEHLPDAGAATGGCFDAGCGSRAR